MIDAVINCAAQLRRAGVDVPVSATLDATAALGHVDVGRRDEVRVALGATLVKRSQDLDTFATVFDRCFRSAPPDYFRSGDDEDGDTLRGEVLVGLEAHDPNVLGDLARRLVERYGGLDAPRASERYHIQRVERAIDLSGAFQHAFRAARDGGARRPALEERLARSELDALIQQLRRALRDEVRLRLSGEPNPLAGGIAVEDIDFLRASTSELRAMRKTVRPLARRLAARVATRDRRRRTGKVDIRRTMRRSLSSGGVPLDPALRRRRHTRPDIWLLCDVSGSVAEFARFTLSFVSAMHGEFPRMRTFVFVDDVEDVSDLLKRCSHGPDLFGPLVQVCGIHASHRSDYGLALRRFWARYGGGGRSLGDVDPDGRRP